MVTVTIQAAVPAAADTWGISGPAFLGFYLLTALAAAVYGFTQRARIIRDTSHTRPHAHPLTVTETAMLFDDRRPVLAGLAQLRGHGLISSAGTPTRGPDRITEQPLDSFSKALLAYLRTGHKKHVLAMSGASTGPLKTLRKSLVDRGYLLSPAQQRSLFLAALPLDALLVLGIIRIVAGSANHKPVVFLILAMIGVFILTVLVMRPVRLTQQGRRTRQETMQRNSHLRPGNSPAYTSYGTDSAALAAALFGAAVIWQLDPELAGNTGTISASGSGGYSGSGSSCSGGGSGGDGGGGGGGGGCGGGGGGCGG
ncbi:TIGR04222 domain-containing membrane protein [Nocardia sp. 2]|uniref:TIGR04222 domain-containing membrane protein n=1 Tax=Nocardia acididurans TaxID=2802282 RepID=A0ABS1LXI7_9NOCA|nr:TIGR04222 domain-containing membrane protein [Nocardia acididurans]MBL1073057.1 TIGR04222 domain-containing membrane protein [Nocardia acididurans]